MVRLMRASVSERLELLARPAGLALEDEVLGTAVAAAVRSTDSGP